MNWFERLTGFTEDGYASTQNRLKVEGDELLDTEAATLFRTATGKLLFVSSEHADLQFATKEVSQ